MRILNIKTGQELTLSLTEALKGLAFAEFTFTKYRPEMEKHAKEELHLLKAWLPLMDTLHVALNQTITVCFKNNDDHLCFDNTDGPIWEILIRFTEHAPELIE